MLRTQNEDLLLRGKIYNYVYFIHILNLGTRVVSQTVRNHDQDNAEWGTRKKVLRAMESVLEASFKARHNLPSISGYLMSSL
jgi:hypothetical protein